MVIYFIDGNVRCEVNCPSLPDLYYYVVDAAEGYSTCMQMLYQFVEHRPNTAILTNFTGALNSEFCYNVDTKKLDMFFVSADSTSWVNVHDLTDSDISCCTDVEAMFRTGMFNGTVQLPEEVKLFEQS